jgi:hypothetical protein
MTDLESLRSTISKWSWRDGAQAVEEIALSGPEATELLAQEMRRRTESSERLYLAAALGYGSGRAGVEELRTATKETGPHTMDLRCAALLALAKRIGSDATDDLALALSDKTGAVREYPMMCLAAVGNESARQAASAQLRSWLKRPGRHQRGEIDAVIYLLRSNVLDQVIELQDLLNECEPRMNSGVRDRLAQLWPEALIGVPITEDDLCRVRANAWSWFLQGFGHLFDGNLPEIAPTYS